MGLGFPWTIKYKSEEGESRNNMRTMHKQGKN
jgi:hypothetical protein